MNNEFKKLLTTRLIKLLNENYYIGKSDREYTKRELTQVFKDTIEEFIEELEDND